MKWTSDIVSFVQPKQSPTPTDTKGSITRVIKDIYFGLEIMFYSCVLLAINAWMTGQKLLKKKKRNSLKG
jgi:hypothetical protein